MIREFIAGLAIGGIGGILTMHYHIVRTNERVLIVSRIHQAPLRSVYVDVREWSPVNWQQYPELSEAVTKAGRADLLAKDNSRREMPQGIPASNVSSGQFRSEAIPMPVLGPAQFQPQMNSGVPANPYGGSTIPTAMLDRDLSDAPLAISPIRSTLPEVASDSIHSIPSFQANQPAATTSDGGQNPTTPSPEKPNWVKSLLQSFIPASQPQTTTLMKLPERMTSADEWSIDPRVLLELARSAQPSSLDEPRVNEVAIAAESAIVVPMVVEDAIVAEAKPIPEVISTIPLSESARPIPSLTPVRLSDADAQAFPYTPYRLKK